MDDDDLHGKKRPELVAAMPFEAFDACIREIDPYVEENDIRRIFDDCKKLQTHRIETSFRELWVRHELVDGVANINQPETEEPTLSKLMRGIEPSFETTRKMKALPRMKSPKNAKKDLTSLEPRTRRTRTRPTSGTAKSSKLQFGCLPGTPSCLTCRRSSEMCFWRCVWMNSYCRTRPSIRCWTSCRRISGRTPRRTWSSSRGARRCSKLLVLILLPAALLHQASQVRFRGRSPLARAFSRSY